MVDYHQQSWTAVHEPYDPSGLKPQASWDSDIMNQNQHLQLHQHEK